LTNAYAKVIRYLSPCTYLKKEYGRELGAFDIKDLKR